MNKICGIYKITSPSGKIYIGQSRDINRRKYEYENHYRTKYQSRIFKSILKYGWENHKFEIICECDKSKLNELEVYYIKFYDTFNTEHGMNLTCGGTNAKMSDETKNKMKISKNENNFWKGHKHSDESKLKIGLAHKGNKYMLGKRHSEETKFKMSILKKGKKLSEEHKNNVINALIGRKCSEETRKKISNTQKINKKNVGKVMPEETKQKIRISNTGKKRSPESCERIRVANTGKRHSDESKKKISENSKNRAGYYEIYNQNNELISKFHGNIRTELKRLNLPRERFLNTYKNNCKVKTEPYKDWYVIKL